MVALIVSYASHAGTPRAEKPPGIALELGGIASIDPVAAARRVLELGGRGAELASIECSAVRSDGQVYLRGPNQGSVTVWYGLDVAPRGDSLVRGYYYSARVDAAGIHDAQRGDARSASNSGKPLLPQCTTRQVWDAAHGQDVPRDLPAQLTFAQGTPLGPGPSRPGWHFYVRATNLQLYIDDATCQVVRPPPDTGAAPDGE